MDEKGSTGQSIVDAIRAHPVRSALLATPPGLFIIAAAIAESWPSFTDEKVPVWCSDNLGWILVNFNPWQIWLMLAGLFTAYALLVWLLFHPRAEKATGREARNSASKFSGITSFQDQSRAIQVEKRKTILETSVVARKTGTPTFAAFLSARPDDLESNEDVIWVCNELERLGHGNPIPTLGKRHGVNPLENASLVEFLRDARLSATIFKTRLDFYRYANRWGFEHGWRDPSYVAYQTAEREASKVCEPNAPLISSEDIE